MELINRLYTDLSSPVCYASANALYGEANRLDPRITRRQIMEYLQGSATYTLHHPRRIHFRRRRIIPKGYFTDFQADLADFQKLARYNKGYRYLLVGIEVLSRRAFAAPVKNKKAPAMKQAFEQIFAEMPTLPWKIFTDRGGEFDAREMKRFYDEKDIIKLSAINVDTKAAMAERMIKTIKHRLYKYFTQNRTLNWVESVPKIVNAINHSVCRSTGLRPVDFNFSNSDELWRKLYPHAFTAEPKPKLREGAVVRVAKDKKAFRKGYLPNFSNLTYRVRNVKRGRPNTYLLENAKGQDLKKKWYREEVTPAVQPTNAKIEKVLRTRMNRATGDREYLIKWEGEPLEAASWITDKDILEIE